MSKVPQILSWAIEDMPSGGAYEVYHHTASIADPDDIATTATKIDETRGHRTIYAASPNASGVFYVRYRRGEIDEPRGYSDWISGPYTSGGLAVRQATAPLAISTDTVSLSIDAGTLEVNGSSELAVKSGVFAFASHTHALSDITDAGTAAAEDVGYFALASHTHAASDIASGTLADARVSESNVTQHEAALTITESQISDLGTYATEQSGAYTAPETAHTEPADFAAVKIALDALGTRIAELQAKLIAAGIGE